MKKKWFVFLIGLFLAGSLAAQIPTILPTSQLTETLELLRGARIKAGQYLNFGSTYGTAGYGIYDNAGTLQYKNSGGSWANLGAGGATTFLALTDTPAAYTAAGGYLVRVNAGANALEFVAGTGSLVGLGSVENTALSTWAGTANITTLGTIGTGAWNATAIADGKIASVLTGKSYNGVTPTALATGFSLAGGTTSKTLTVELDSLVNQDLTTDSSPSFSGFTLGSITTNGTANFYGIGAAGYFSIIKGSNAEGLAGADLRIGLDESNRSLIVCDRGDINTDLGLTARTNPTIDIWDAASGSNVSLSSTSIKQVSGGYLSIYGSGSLYLRGNQDNLSVGNWINIDSAPNQLNDSDGRQAWLAVSPNVSQTGTAAFDGIYVNATNTTLGTGATGNGNNLLNLSVSAVPKFLVNVDGSVTAGQVSVSLADNAVHDTGITAFYGQLTVKDTTTGVTGIFRLDGGATPVIISAHTNFSTTQGTDVKINVYFSTTYKIENCNTAASVVKCAFVGTI